MKRPRLDDEGLRRLLRAGDPALLAPELDPSEQAEIRRAMTRALPPAPAAMPPFRWAAAGALVALGLVATALLREPAALPPSPTTEPSHPVATRQLDFRTPGGTRLIWVFDAPGPKENS